MLYDPAATRKRLVDAARAEFEERGFDQATGLAIYERAKVSSGSWRHTFHNGKMDVAAVIYPLLQAEIWEPVLESLGNPPSSPDARPIERAIDELLKQVTSNRGRAKLLFELQVVLARPRYVGIVAECEGAVRSRIATWVSLAVGTGTPGPISDLSFGLVFGPAVDLCRLWAFGHLADIPKSATRFLAGAAADGLRSKSLPRVSQERAPKKGEGSAGGALMQDLLVGADAASHAKPTDRATIEGKASDSA